MPSNQNEDNLFEAEDEADEMNSTSSRRPKAAVFYKLPRIFEEEEDNNDELIWEKTARLIRE